MTDIIQFDNPFPTEQEIEDNPGLLTDTCNFCKRPKWLTGNLIGGVNPKNPTASEKFICKECVSKCNKLLKASIPLPSNEAA